MGWDRTFPLAFLKAQMGAGTHLPERGRVFLSVRDADKTPALAEAARDLVRMGFEIVATRGTAAWLASEGVPSQPVNKVYEGRPNIVDQMKDGQVALVMNTTEGAQAIADSRDIRRVALMDRIPYFTTAAGAVAAVAAMRARGEGYGVRTLQG
jgi:carbamoyl-phosphate synthase large subunit